MDMDPATGEAVEGWAGVVKSLQTILATRLSTRVFLREFGSRVGNHIDAPMNDENILSLYVSVAEAIERWEPRFDLSGVQIEPNSSGVLIMSISGTYVPNAHLGDFSVVSDSAQVIRFQSDRIENWRLAA